MVTAEQLVQALRDLVSHIDELGLPDGGADKYMQMIDWAGIEQSGMKIIISSLIKSFQETDAYEGIFQDGSEQLDLTGPQVGIAFGVIHGIIIGVKAASNDNEQGWWLDN